MVKILILTGDAGESLEVMYPLQRMREEGYDVDVAAPEKRRYSLWFMISRMDSTHIQKNWDISFRQIWHLGM